MAGWPLPSPSLLGLLQEQGAKADGFQTASAFASVLWRRLGLGLFGFSPPLLLALPRDPFFRCSGDAGCSLSHLEK